MSEEALTSMDSLLAQQRLLTTDIAQKGLAHANRTAQELETSVQRLEDEGHGNLAEELRSTVEMQRLMRLKAVDLKTQLYIDQQLAQKEAAMQHSTDAAYVAMRQKLTQAQSQAAKHHADLAAALQAHLTRLGLRGSKTASDIATMLAGLRDHAMRADSSTVNELVRQMEKTCAHARARWKAMS